MDMRGIVGQNLRRIRKEKGLSQEDLALKSDIDRSYVGALERGVYSATVTMVGKLAKVLGVEPSTLLEKPPKNRKR